MQPSLFKGFPKQDTCASGLDTSLAIVYSQTKWRMGHGSFRRILHPKRTALLCKILDQDNRVFIQRKLSRIPFRFRKEVVLIQNIDAEAFGKVCFNFRGLCDIGKDHSPLFPVHSRKGIDTVPIAMALRLIAQHIQLTKCPEGIIDAGRCIGGQVIEATIGIDCKVHGIASIMAITFAEA